MKPLRVGHYAGDPLVSVDPETVRAAVETYRPDAPAGYALDFGRTDDGRTLLVEANDGYSLGNYGLKPIAYATLLERRWREVVGAS